MNFLYPHNISSWEDLGGELRSAIVQYFGEWVIFVLLVLVGGFWVWKNWKQVKELPGVPWIISRVYKRSLPKAGSENFTIGVADIECDEKGEMKRVIMESLHEFPGINILAVPRVIRVDQKHYSQGIEDGHMKGRILLTKTGAHALLWGKIIRLDNRSIPKLYWTVFRERSGEKNGVRYNPTQDLTLPPIFWNDLIQVLRLVIVEGYATYSNLNGHYYADKIKPFIDRVKAVLAGGGNEQNGLTGEARAHALFILGKSSTVFGDQAGDNTAILESINFFREALQEWTRKRVPLDWAMAQNNLGIALARLGEREAGTHRLEEAVQAFREALQEWTRKRVPLDWAAAQNNLGGVLQVLGRREGGTARLEEAVQAFREALQEWTRERVPLDWATAQNNMGIALQSLGGRETGTERLEVAVQAYREALQERTRERVPLNWATTQNNMGNALAMLGERETGTERLEEAVQAYREALQERRRERVPLDWATTQNNLGGVLARLGGRETGTERLEEAVGAFREALQERRRERVPLDWASTQSNMGNALAMLGERETGTERLEEAVQAYREALRIITKEFNLDHFGQIQQNLAHVISEIQKRNN